MKTIRISTHRSAALAAPLWLGVASGATHFGEIDLTSSLSYLQDFPGNSLHLESNFGFALSLGARIGLLEETRTLPGTSFAISHRYLPSFNFASDPMPVVGGGTMTMGGESIDVGVTSWRLAASKRIGPAGLTAGFGGDWYDGSGTVNAALSRTNPAGMSGSQYFNVSANRRNLFVGGSYTVRRVTLVGEYGHLSQAGDYLISASNTFGGRTAGMSRNYLSLGVRLRGRR